MTTESSKPDARKVVPMDWDDFYLECESNCEGQIRDMVRYAYERGYEDHAAPAAPAWTDAEVLARVDAIREDTMQLPIMDRLELAFRAGLAAAAPADHAATQRAWSDAARYQFLSKHAGLMFYKWVTYESNMLILRPWDAIERDIDAGLAAAPAKEPKP